MDSECALNVAPVSPPSQHQLYKSRTESVKPTGSWVGCHTTSLQRNRYVVVCIHHTGLPHNSAGKEPPCSAGDPSSIPRSGRSTRVGIGNPLQYSSFVVQLVKNPSAMWETWVPSLGWEYPLEKGKDTHSSILAWRISMN